MERVNTSWKSASVETSCSPEKVWSIYRQLHWQEWDHDILTMKPVDLSGQLLEGAKLVIEMKDGKQHIATIKDVKENKCFSYTSPLPGATMEAIHVLEAMQSGGTRITHTFSITGLFGRIYRWLVHDYVQDGLNSNTQALKLLAESQK